MNKGLFFFPKQREERRTEERKQPRNWAFQKHLSFGRSARNKLVRDKSLASAPPIDFGGQRNNTSRYRGAADRCADHVIK